jgi:G3E family GTPase
MVSMCLILKFFFLSLQFNECLTFKYEFHIFVLFLQVESWLEDLLWERKSSMDIYRCKGILHIHDSDQVHTLQVVTSYKESEGVT